MVPLNILETLYGPELSLPHLGIAEVGITQSSNTVPVGSVGQVIYVT